MGNKEKVASEYTKRAGVSLSVACAAVDIIARRAGAGESPGQIASALRDLHNADRLGRFTDVRIVRSVVQSLRSNHA